MINENEVQKLNKFLKNNDPLSIIEKSLKLSGDAILTTNFRPYEASILHAVCSVKYDLPIVWCDTGYNTKQTYIHAEYLISLLNLNIFLYVPKQTVAHRESTMGVPNIEDPQHKLFTEQVKLEPFKRALEYHKPKIWFTNLRKGQTDYRDSLDIFSLTKEGILKVCPFYYWTDKDLDSYLDKNNLPNEFNYVDPTKSVQNRECGLHFK
jgi:phosphoadenosine phosphosulfate reductase